MTGHDSHTAFVGSLVGRSASSEEVGWVCLVVPLLALPCTFDFDLLLTKVPFNLDFKKEGSKSAFDFFAELLYFVFYVETKSGPVLKMVERNLELDGKGLNKK